MAFNIKAWGDNLVDYALKRANKAISDTERNILLAMRQCVNDMFNTLRANAAWQNRTYNLVSSFYAVLFYNGKILGVETAGAEADKGINKKGSKGKKEVVKTTATRLNPIFSYWFTGEGNVAWKNDPQDPKRTGRVFANEGVDYAKQNVSKEGYSIVIGFAVPYARSPRGFLNLKVSATLGVILANLYDTMASMGLEPSTRKLKGIGDTFWENDVS